MISFLIISMHQILQPDITCQHLITGSLPAGCDVDNIPLSSISHVDPDLMAIFFLISRSRGGLYSIQPIVCNICGIL
jgi:hypothetical protein